MQGSCQSKTHLLCHYNFFLTCFHMLRLHEKCFIICMLEMQKFVLVQILSLCQFVNNENIKNKIIWLNVGTSLVLQETPLKAAFSLSWDALRHWLQQFKTRQATKVYLTVKLFISIWDILFYGYGISRWSSSSPCLLQKEKVLQWVLFVLTYTMTPSGLHIGIATDLS